MVESVNRTNSSFVYFGNLSTEFGAVGHTSTSRWTFSGMGADEATAWGMLAPPLRSETRAAFPALSNLYWGLASWDFMSEARGLGMYSTVPGTGKVYQTGSQLYYAGITGFTYRWAVDPGVYGYAHVTNTVTYGEILGTEADFFHSAVVYRYTNVFDVLDVRAPVGRGSPSYWLQWGLSPTSHAAAPLARSPLRSVTGAVVRYSREVHPARRITADLSVHVDTAEGRVQADWINNSVLAPDVNSLNAGPNGTARKIQQARIVNAKFRLIITNRSAHGMMLIKRGVP